MGRFLKHMIAAAAFRSGFLLCWWRRQRRPLVLMYHRVLEPEQGVDLSQRGLVVSTTTFARQLASLRRRFRLVPLASVAAAREELDVGDASRPACAVTFDDGWADNYQHALPVLERLRVPATVFVATGYIDTCRAPFPEQLHFILGGEERRRLQAAHLDGSPRAVAEAVVDVARADDTSLADALDELIEVVKTIDEQSRDALIDVLIQATGRDPADLDRRMLDWSEVRALSAAGIEIASHSVEHTILTRVDRARVKRELRESRQQLEAVLGGAPVGFAYPDGAWNPELASLVEAAGYRYAVVTEPGGAVNDRHHPFAIPRKNVAEGSSRGCRGFSESVFLCEATGFFDVLRRLGGRG